MKEENKENGLIIYQDDNGSVKVNVRFSDEDVWLTQAQLAEIYATTQQNIAPHIKNIYAEDELEAEATHKKFLLVRQEGARSVRRWATERLHEYIQKGFAMDDDLLYIGLKSRGVECSYQRYNLILSVQNDFVILQ